MLVYLDTSALAKWYLNEPGSEEFSAWIRDQHDTHISSLTALEMRCLLARRKRRQEISSELEQQIFAAFQADIKAGHLIQHPVEDAHLQDAIQLLDRVSPTPLRTLDALHLRIAIATGAEAIATADNVMATAASELGIKVLDFAQVSLRRQPL